MISMKTLMIAFVVLFGLVDLVVSENTPQSEDDHEREARFIKNWSWFHKSWDDFKEKAANVTQKVKEVAGNALEKVKDFIESAYDDVREFFQKKVEDVRKNFKETINVTATVDQEKNPEAKPTARREEKVVEDVKVEQGAA